MPTRISGWIAALALLLASFLLSQEDDLVSWQSMLPVMAAWIVLGEAAFWAMRLLAPAPPPPAWFKTNGVVLTVVLGLFVLAGAPVDPQVSELSNIAFIGLLIALAWLSIDLLALALWRLSRGPAASFFTVSRVIAWVMAAIAVSLPLLPSWLDAEYSDTLPGYLVLTLTVLLFVLIGAAVFFDYPTALDRRRRNQDFEFQEQFESATRTQMVRILPGMLRR